MTKNTRDFDSDINNIWMRLEHLESRKLADHKEAIDSISLAAFGITIVAGLVSLVIIFGGSPDVADAWVCQRMKADAAQCARILQIQNTDSTTTTTTTTTKTPIK